MTAPVRPNELHKIQSESRSLGRLTTHETIDEVLDHPLLRLLSEPTQNTGTLAISRFELLELTQLSLDILGRAYWQVLRNGLGMPVGIWPLAAQYVRPLVRDQGRIVEYEWTADRQPVRIPAEDIIPFHMPDLCDPVVGARSAAQAAFDRIGLVDLFVRHQHAVLENRARPDLVISPSQPDGVLGDAEANRLENAFSRRFRGQGSGGVFVSRDGVRVDSLDVPHRDPGEFAENQASLEQIARSFDIPLSMLNRDANRASAEQGRTQHASDAIVPRLIRIVDRLNQRLVPMFDPSRRLFLRFDDPVKESVELKLRTRSLNLRLGFTTINEERAEEGYPPVPWGDEPWKPTPERT
jgi:HK97 family phage portal protein